MQWNIGSESHVGRVCSVVPDGRLSYDIGGLGVLVQGVSGMYPRDTVRRDHEVVSDDDVIGWRSVCLCGWEGSHWSRVKARSKARLSGRTAFVPFLGFATPPVSAEAEMHEEWLLHARQAIAINDLQSARRRLAAAEASLSNAVARGRSVGLSWTSVASALGITRQSAHARWRAQE